MGWDRSPYRSRGDVENGAGGAGRGRSPGPEPLEGLVAEEIRRLGGIMENLWNTSYDPHQKRAFEDLLRGCDYTFRAGKLVIFAPNPARAARVRLESEQIARAWLALNPGQPEPTVVVRTGRLRTDAPNRPPREPESEG